MLKIFQNPHSLMQFYFLDSLGFCHAHLNRVFYWFFWGGIDRWRLSHIGDNCKMPSKIGLLQIIRCKFTANRNQWNGLAFISNLNFPSLISWFAIQGFFLFHFSPEKDRLPEVCSLHLTSSRSTESRPLMSLESNGFLCTTLPLRPTFQSPFSSHLFSFQIWSLLLPPSYMVDACFQGWFGREAIRFDTKVRFLKWGGEIYQEIEEWLGWNWYWNVQGE